MDPFHSRICPRLFTLEHATDYKYWKVKALELLDFAGAKDAVLTDPPVPYPDQLPTAPAPTADEKAAYDAYKKIDKIARAAVFYTGISKDLELRLTLDLTARAKWQHLEVIFDKPDQAALHAEFTMY